MQKYPGGGHKEHFYAEEVVEDFSFKDDFHYNKGSSGFHMKPAGHCSPDGKPMHNYGNNSVQAYEYDNYGDSFNKGHDGYTVQHTEARIEREQYMEPWNHGNKYSGGHGGKHHMTAQKYQSHTPHGYYGVMDGGYTGGGYGGHQHHAGEGYGGHQHHAGGGYGGHHHAGGGFGGHHGNQQLPYWNSKGIQD